MCHSKNCPVFVISQYSSRQVRDSEQASLTNYSSQVSLGLKFEQCKAKIPWQQFPRSILVTSSRGCRYR